MEGFGRTQYWLYHVVGAYLAVPFGSAEPANLFLLTLVALGFSYGLRTLITARVMAALRLYRSPRSLIGPPEVAPPTKPVVFWDWTPCASRNSTDGAYYDYVLVRGSLNPFQDAPGPRWKLISGAQAWRLFARDPSAPPLTGLLLDRGPCAN